MSAPRKAMIASGTFVIVLALAATMPALGGGPPDHAQGKAKGIDKRAGGCAVPYELPDPIAGLEVAAKVPLVGEGHGIWVDDERCLLYWTGAVTPPGEAHEHGLLIFDVRDPGSPVHLSTLDVWGPGRPGPRDVETMTVDGLEIVVLSLEGFDEDGVNGKSGIGVVDVSDPADPVILAERYGFASHNLGAVAGTPYVYSATGTLHQRIIPVLDLSVPEDPVWHTIEMPTMVNGVPVMTDGCHDVTVQVGLGRAYCAGGGSFYMSGGGQTFIWDISEDPLDPQWIGVFDDPRIVYHHAAVPSPDGNTLYVGDEHITANNCVRHETPLGELKNPVAALWVVDIADPAQPEAQGYVQAPTSTFPFAGERLPNRNCGVHFGDVVDETGFVVWGWYTGGTLLIDARDKGAPKVVDVANADWAASFDNWDVRYANGHAFTSSQDDWPDSQYMKVFRLV